MMTGNNIIPSGSYILKLISLILVIISCNGSLYSQNEDFELWTGISLAAKPFKNISFDLEEEIRFRNNAGETDSYHTDAGISFELWKGFTVAGHYRFIMGNEEDERYSKTHRYYFDLSYSKKLDRFELFARTRYQTRYKDINNSEPGHIPENYSRNKIGLDYDIYRTPLKVRLWFEFYYQLNNPAGNSVDKIRFAPELRYKINRFNELKMFYMIEKEYFVRDPALIYILGIGYAYDI